jgi:hypothetical protein
LFFLNCFFDERGEMLPMLCLNGEGFCKSVHEEYFRFRQPVAQYCRHILGKRTSCVGDIAQAVALKPYHLPIQYSFRPVDTHALSRSTIRQLTSFARHRRFHKHPRASSWNSALRVIRKMGISNFANALPNDPQMSNQPENIDTLYSEVVFLNLCTIPDLSKMEGRWFRTIGFKNKKR